MNKVCFVNGSPRGKNSASKRLIDKVVEMLDKQATQVHEICVMESLKHNTTEGFCANEDNELHHICIPPLY
jgi:hypothetical protein